jgi:hypothetical protein
MVSGTRRPKHESSLGKSQNTHLRKRSLGRMIWEENINREICSKDANWKEFTQDNINSVEPLNSTSGELDYLCRK